MPSLFASKTKFHEYKFFSPRDDVVHSPFSSGNSRCEVPQLLHEVRPLAEVRRGLVLRRRLLGGARDGEVRHHLGDALEGPPLLRGRLLLLHHRLLLLVSLRELLLLHRLLVGPEGPTISRVVDRTASPPLGNSRGSSRALQRRAVRKAPRRPGPTGPAQRWPGRARAATPSPILLVRFERACTATMRWSGQVRFLAVAPHLKLPGLKRSQLLSL